MSTADPSGCVSGPEPDCPTPPPPLQLWFTSQEWEFLDEDDIASAAPLSLALFVLQHAEAEVDVVAVTTGLWSRTSARIAIHGGWGVQLAQVRLGGAEGVRLVVFAVSLLAAELADLVPVGPAAVAHPARHDAAYPLELFLAGLAAAPRQGPVLAHISELIAREALTASPGRRLGAGQVARQLSHLVDSCVGRLEALVRAGSTQAPAVSWTLTTSGWFALVPVVRPAQNLVAVRPVVPGDIAAAVASALAMVLPAHRRPSGVDLPPAR